MGFNSAFKGLNGAVTGWWPGIKKMWS